MHIDRSKIRGGTYCDLSIPIDIQEELRKSKVTDMTNHEDGMFKKNCYFSKSANSSLCRPKM